MASPFFPDAARREAVFQTPAQFDLVTPPGSANADEAPASPSRDRPCVPQRLRSETAASRHQQVPVEAAAPATTRTPKPATTTTQTQEPTPKKGQPVFERNDPSEDSHSSDSETADAKDSSIIGTQPSAQRRSTQAASQPYADMTRSRLVKREALPLLERITGTRHLDRLLPAIQKHLRGEHRQACLDGFKKEKSATNSYTAVTWLEQLSALFRSVFSEKAPSETIALKEPHVWLRGAVSGFAKETRNKDEQVRKPDAVLTRASFAEQTHKGRPGKRRRGNTTARPVFRRCNALALCEFTTQQADLHKKRRDFIFDLSDVLREQPFRGCIPGLFFAGSKASPTVELIVVDYECIRIARIENCFAAKGGLATLVAIVGVLSCADEEMLTFLPKLDPVGDIFPQPPAERARQQPLSCKLRMDAEPLASEVAGTVCTEMSRGENAPSSCRGGRLAAASPPEGTAPALTVSTAPPAPPPMTTTPAMTTATTPDEFCVTLLRRLTVGHHVFGRNTTIYTAQPPPSWSSPLQDGIIVSATAGAEQDTGSTNLVAVKWGWIADLRACRELRILRAMQGTLPDHPVMDIPPEFQRYLRGDIFSGPDAWRAYLPTVTSSRIYGRFGWRLEEEALQGASWDAQLDAADTVALHIVRRHLELYTMWPVGRAIPQKRCKTDEVWLKRCRLYAKLMAELVSVVQWQFQNNVLHRDISAANVLMSAWGTVLLIDFDCAKVLQSTRTCRAEHTGHLDCMAIDMLEGIQRPKRAERQRPRHDLESVLYLFINLLYESMSTELRAATPAFDDYQKDIHTAVKQADRAAAGILAHARTCLYLEELGDDLVRRQPAFQDLRILLLALDGLRDDGLCRRKKRSDPFNLDNPEAEAQNSDERFWILSSRMHDAFTAFAAA